MRGLCSPSLSGLIIKTWLIARPSKAFCNALWASVSLSSEFHPQTNGQAAWAVSSWKLCCIVSQLITAPAGAPNYPGLIMPPPTPAGPPLSFSWFISLLYSPSRRMTLLSLLCKPTSTVAARYGERPVLPCSAPPSATVAWLTIVRFPHLTTSQVKRCGFLPRTSH